MRSVSEAVLREGYRLAKERLDEPRIAYKEKLYAKGASRSHAYEVMEQLLANFYAVKAVFNGNRIMPSLRASFNNLYSLYCGANEAFLYISKYATHSQIVPVEQDLPFDREYSLIENIIRANLFMLQYVTSCSAIDSVSRYYTEWLMQEIVREAQRPKYEQFKREDNSVSINGRYYHGFDEQVSIKVGYSANIMPVAKPSSLEAVTLDMIGGQRLAKEQALYIIKSLKNPDAGKRVGIRPVRGAIFYGPPGCGKTMLAKAIAYSVGMQFYYYNIADLLSKFLGESENITKAAMQMEGIIFFDEFDSLGKVREDNLGVSLNLVNIISSEMDGFNVNKYKPKNLILAATNDIDAVSKKLLRPGKFDEIIEFVVPDREELEDIFSIHLEHARKISGVNYSVDVHTIAEELYKKSVELQNQGFLGLVGADVENILRLSLKKIHLQVLDNNVVVKHDSLKEQDIIEIIRAYDVSKRQDRKRNI